MMKKKILCLLTALTLAATLTGCESDIISNPFEEEVIGNDWHVWTAYDGEDWTGPEGTEYIYIEYLDEGVRLLKEGDSYCPISDCLTEDEIVHDQAYVCNTKRFTDVNGDGYDDFVFSDLVDGQEMEYVFLYDTTAMQMYFEFDSVTAKGQSADTEDYMKFINGEIKAGYCNVKDLEEEYSMTYGEEYSLSEMIDNYLNYCNEFWDTGYTLASVKYAFVDAADDGKQELAVEVSFNDESYSSEKCDMLFTKTDESINLVLANLCGYRSWTTVNKYGVMATEGSDGAASNYQSYSVVTKNGYGSSLYELYTISALSEPLVPSYYLSECPEDYPDIYGDTEGSYTCLAYGFGANEDMSRYFVFEDAEGNDISAAEEYAKLYEEQEISCISKEEAEELIAAACEEADLTEDMLYDTQEPEWIDLEIEE